ncbi:hypothetical protein C7M84_010008, partial [Penaeus vannamei]
VIQPPYLLISVSPGHDAVDAARPGRRGARGLARRLRGTGRRHAARDRRRAQASDLEDTPSAGGILSRVFPEGFKRSPADEVSDAAAASIDYPDAPTKTVVKRSTEIPDGYMAAMGYNPMNAWAKRNGYDPGYEAYMQSLAYDPTMAFGKRQLKRNDGFQSYMQTLNYNPTAAWGKRSDYDAYLQSTGYDPMAVYAKKTVKRSSDYPSVYQEIPSGPRKDEEFGEIYYPQHFFNAEIKKQDPYMDMYLPNQYMHSFKRSITPYLLSVASNDWKRAPNEMGAQGFHEGIFTHNFGDFSPVKKRGKREADPSAAAEKDSALVSSDGNYDDYAMAKRRLGMGASGFHGDTFSQGFGDFSTMKKRRLGMGASGFHGDTFSQGFGDFSTMKKRRLGMGASGFHGDTFNEGFGDFSTMKKRRLGMDASGFYGDTFSQGFGDFSTMKKRRLGMGASGFHGDTFSQGFGDFSTMKKRRLGMGASGFHGDTFSQGFGDFSTMKKRRPEMDSSGFYGDTFSNGFGSFYTMKRRPEMDSSGFYGDTFSNGFGDFATMKKKDADDDSQATESSEQDKKSTRRKRQAGDLLYAESPETDANTQGLAMDSGLLELRIPQQQDGRPKRNLEGSDIMEVEMKPPVETSIKLRSRRGTDGGDLLIADYPVTYVGDEEGAAPAPGRSRTLAKRAAETEEAADPFADALGGFETMKRRR